MWSPADAVGRKLVALLRPWLLGDPHLEVRLGFFRSHIIASDLLLDALALNRLLHASAGGGVLFRSAQVRRVTVAFSPWSVPAFAVSVNGLHVQLQRGNVSPRQKKDADYARRERHRVLDSVDPQGSFLEEITAYVLAMSSFKDCFTNSLRNVIMGHLQFQVNDILVNMQLPMPTRELSLFIKAREVSVDGLLVKPSNIFLDVIGVVIAPRQEGSFKLICSWFEIGCKKDDGAAVLAFSNNFWVSARLWNFQFIDVHVHVLNVELTLCMGYILDLIMAHDVFFAEEIRVARNGKELWKLAIRRTSSLISTRFFLYKLIDAVLAWMRYMEAYKDFLCVLGYYSEESFRENMCKIKEEVKYCALVKQLYDKACKLEEQLPVEAVAHARKIARSEGDASRCNGWQSQYGPRRVSLGHLLLYVPFLLYLVCYAVPWFMCFLYYLCVGIFYRDFKMIKSLDLFSVVSSCLEFKRVCSFNIKDVSIRFNVFPVPIDADSKTGIENQLLNYYVYSFVIRSLCFSCEQDLHSKSFIFTCGNAGAGFTTSSACPFFSGSHKDQKDSLIEDGEKRFIWVESAPHFSPPKKPVNPADYAGKLHHVILENHIGSLWLDWKKRSMRFAEDDAQLLEPPFLLYEVKHHLVDPCCHRPNRGMSNINLALGKLHIKLHHLLLVSLNQLFDEIQNPRCLSGCKIEKGVSCASGPDELLGNTSWASRLESLDSSLKALINRILPVQNVQLGLVIACPLIRLPSRNFGVAKEYKYRHFIFDFGMIEAAVWPSVPSFLSSMTGLNEADIGFLQFGKSELTRIDEQHHTGRFFLKCSTELDACLSLDGASAFWEDLKEKKKYPVVNPLSFKFHFSTFRVFLYSLQSVSSMVVTLNAWISGVSILIFMDELDAILQMLSFLLSSISPILREYGPTLTGDSQIFARHDIVINSKDNDNINFYYIVIRWFTIHAFLEVKSVTILLDKHRKVHITGSDFTNSLVEENVYFDGRLPSLLNLVNYGVGIYLHQINAQTIHEEGHVQVEAKCQGLDSSIFRHSDATISCIHESRVEKLLLYPVCCLYGFSVSDLTFNLYASRGNILTTENCDSIISHPNSFISSSKFCRKLNLPRVVCDYLEDSSVPVIVMRIYLGVLFMSVCSIKEELNKALEPKTLQALFTSVGVLSQELSFEIQGGLLALEAEALTMFARCFNTYFLCFVSLLERLLREMHYEKVQSTLSNDISSENAWSLVRSIKFHQQDFCVVIAIVDRSGVVWRLMSEHAFVLTIIREEMKIKIAFEIPHISIISQHLRPITSEQLEESPLRYFSSTENDIINRAPPLEDSSSSKHPMRSRSLNIKNYILKDGVVSINVEKAADQNREGLVDLKTLWFGSGSISGLHFNINLADIQMLLVLTESLPTRLQGRDVDLKAGQNHVLENTIQNHESEMIVPDGAVIAIKDLRQHLYLAIESMSNQYRVVGTMHHSLVGENALFKVRYCNRGRRRSKRLLFSLMSISAKNGKGEPLCLTFDGSLFVNVSSGDEKGSLWSMNSYEIGNDFDGGDIDLNNDSSARIVSLLNERSNCSATFIDGCLMFVKGAGSPFKVKIFDRLILNHENPPGEASVAGVCCSNNGSDGSTGRTPNIVVSILDISLTLSHELAGGDEMFPLVKCSIDNSYLIMQLLSTKMRFINKLLVAIFYFDMEKNIWRDFVLPFNICIFYYYKFADKVIGIQQTCTHLYIGVDKGEIYVNQLSLDMVLYLVGELNLAGPFAVKQPLILANCCQVKNETSLSLICHFDFGKDVLVSGKQSGTVISRTSMSEKKVSMTLQLSGGDFVTSPIHFLIPDTQRLAFRTRMASLKDSSAFPGPLVMVDISEKKQDGTSVIVSPMLTVHNESGFPMLLCFRRPENPNDESASVILRNGESFDDTLAVFDSLKFSGGRKKALMSLTLGNFILSFKPVIDQYEKFGRSVSVDWSNDLMGSKQVPLLGLLDKLNFTIKRAFGACPVRSSFSTTCCFICMDGKPVSSLHFFMRSNKREVPVVQAPSSANPSSSKAKPLAVYEQKEIFLYPTVKIINHVQSEVLVLLSECDPGVSMDEDLAHIGKRAIIPAGASSFFYANPSVIYITVALLAFNLRSQPVNSQEWMKKLNKLKHEVRCLDIELGFVGGKCAACLQLSRGDTGILEVIIYTRYMLQNRTDHSLLVAPSHKLLSWNNESDGCSIPPEHGCILTPRSFYSWFPKSNKVYLKVVKEGASSTLLDMDSISGLTEVSLKFQEKEDNYVQMVGVSASLPKEMAPSQLISFVPRYVIFNASNEDIILRHYLLEGDSGVSIAVKSHQKSSIPIFYDASKKRVVSLFDSFLKKHKNPIEDSDTYVRFSLKEPGWSCSGPVCIASLGKFFLKFRRSAESLSKSELLEDGNLSRYASVHIVEDDSSLVMNFLIISNEDLPYRIENCLSNASIMYYQKGSEDVELLQAGRKSGYVWSNLTLPHKLILQINGMNETVLVREINIDKVTPWKPLGKSGSSMRTAFMSTENKLRNLRKNHHQSPLLKIFNVGYEIITDDSTRVLRVSEYTNSSKEDKMAHLRMRVQMRFSSVSVHLFNNVENPEAGKFWSCEQLVVVRLSGISLCSIVDYEYASVRMQIQTLKVENKWDGAPFSAMLRRHQLDDDSNDCVLSILFNIKSNNSDVKQIDHFSILFQPMDLKLDEETLMRLTSFWRVSLADPNSPSRRFYFKSFEIQPVKIVASFLPTPVDKNSNHDTAQEALRSILHSVIKVPVVKNMVVELNGILLTHALVTTRELAFKCAQHYSWYAMRSIYVAKGSTLLPPAFASVFDDTASGSLDMFFDPSSGLVNLPGLSLGMFKFASKCIDSKGLSGTKRYLGDLSKTLRTAGSNVMFAAITAVSDSVVKGAEINGFGGMVSGFHQGMLKLAMEPSFIGIAVMEGGSNRIIKLDKSPGADELYVEGYLQAMLDLKYYQVYLKIRVIDDQVIIKNLPPNNSIINEIVDNVKIILVNNGLLQGEASKSFTRLHYFRGENEFRIVPTILTLCEHLFVSFSIRILRKQTSGIFSHFQWKDKSEEGKQIVLPLTKPGGIFIGKWGITKLVLSGIVAYIDGRLCRCIPNAIARRIVSGYLLSFLDKDNDQ